MNISTPQPSFTRDVVRGFCIWGMGWFVFAIIEALLIITRTPALRCATVLLSITAYAIAGAVGGMIIACMQHFLGRSRRDSQNLFGAEIACYSGCIASILLCAGLAIIKNKLFVKAQLPAVISLSLLFCVLCAGMYLPYHDLLFRNQNALADDDLIKYAREAGLEEGTFVSCLQSGKATSTVEKDIADAEAAGVNGTPAFFINGRPLSGAQPYDAFKDAIEDELAWLYQ